MGHVFALPDGLQRAGQNGDQRCLQCVMQDTSAHLKGVANVGEQVLLRNPAVCPTFTSSCLTTVSVSKSELAVTAMSIRPRDVGRMGNERLALPLAGTITETGDC